MLEYHSGEDLYEVFGSFNRVNPHGFNSLLIINLGAFNVLHDNDSLCARFLVILWDIDVGVVLE